MSRIFTMEEIDEAYKKELEKHKQRQEKLRNSVIMMMAKLNEKIYGAKFNMEHGFLDPSHICRGENPDDYLITVNYHVALRIDNECNVEMFIREMNKSKKKFKRR